MKYDQLTEKLLDNKWRIDDDQITPYDDWGKDSQNNNAITEAGLSRIIQKIKLEDNDFVVITAYRGENDKKTNIAKNAQLRDWFNRNKMGVYQLVGHWRECSIQGVEYENCPTDKLVDVVERSYLAIRPDEMDSKDFFNKVKYLTSTYKQDGSVIRVKELYGDDIRIVSGSGRSFSAGRGVQLDKVAQAYSQHVKKINVPFVFEGVEVPATNLGFQIAKELKFGYPVGKWDDLRSWDDIGGE